MDIPTKSEAMSLLAKDCVNLVKFLYKSLFKILNYLN